MRSKTATGKATVTTGPDEHLCIHWEASLEAQHPPCRKGEKPSESCSAKSCGHSQEFCTCPGNASLPTSTRTSLALRFSLWTHSQGKRRESSSTGTLAHPLLNNAPEPNKMLSLCPHPSVESRSVVMMFLETLPSWLKWLHLQITAFWAACKEVGRADDNIALKLPKAKCWQAGCWTRHSKGHSHPSSHSCNLSLLRWSSPPSAHLPAALTTIPCSFQDKIWQ